MSEEIRAIEWRQVRAPVLDPAGGCLRESVRSHRQIPPARRPKALVRLRKYAACSRAMSS